MKVIQYKIHAPTVLDFLKVFLVDVLGIEIKNRTDTKIKEEFALKINGHNNCNNNLNIDQNNIEKIINL